MLGVLSTDTRSNICSPVTAKPSVRASHRRNLLLIIFLPWFFPFKSYKTFTIGYLVLYTKRQNLSQTFLSFQQNYTLGGLSCKGYIMKTDLFRAIIWLMPLKQYIIHSCAKKKSCLYFFSMHKKRICNKGN